MDRKAETVVITGASAGVGRATVREFAKRGAHIGLVARGKDGLEGARKDVESLGGKALAFARDVSKEGALEEVADAVERELGPIDVWVNDAMATIFAPVSDISPDEFRRVTEVTYLGQVYGTMAALRRMRPRNRGTIVQIGSALSYRAIPLQSAYCGAKFAVRGFTDSLRSELLHDGVNVRLTMVHLPALNTLQFDWALNKIGRRPQPVPPIFQPEVAARAIVFAAFHHRREVWVGVPTVKTILANRLAPGLLDRLLAQIGYTGQLTQEPATADKPANLFEPVPGPYSARGRFDTRAKGESWEFFASRHRAALAGVIGLAAWVLLSKQVRTRIVA